MAKSHVIMIKLAGRSPRLVRRWCELGLLPGFAMLTHQPSPQLAGGGYVSDEFSDSFIRNCQTPELWANDLGCESLLALDAGVKTNLSDLGIENVIDALPQQHSLHELASSLFSAGISVLSIARALISCRPALFDSQPQFERTSLDLLRWEVFRSRWQACQPATSLLRLPGPDWGETPGVTASQEVSFCPDRQFEYAQTLMRSYLLIDLITQQAVRMARRHQLGLIVSIEAPNA